MVKGIIFDFWGTLVENGIYPSPVQQVKYILRVPMKFKDFVSRFENVMMTKTYSDLNEAFDAVCREFRITPTPFITERMVGMWNKNELLGKPFLETVEILDYLKEKKIKMGLILNTTPGITKVLEKYDLNKYFDGMVLSCEEGLLKSNPEMFQRLLKKMKLNAEDVVVVGDSIPSDVMGARNAGLRAVLVDRKNNREFEPKILNLRELMSKIEDGSLKDFASIKADVSNAEE